MLPRRRTCAAPTRPAATDGGARPAGSSSGPDLQNRQPVRTGPVSQRAAQFVDPETPELCQQFYRGVPEATAPLE